MMSQAPNSSDLTLDLNWTERGDPLFDTGLPLLSGSSGRPWFAKNMIGLPTAEGIRLLGNGEWLMGVCIAEPGRSLAEATRRIYRDALRNIRGWHLARCWNFIPEINSPGDGGLERYRIFSRERSLAFEDEYGADFCSRLPAASAVGTDADTLRVAFVATRRCPRHVENPWQVPAYRYPSDYGPRPPSFARATVVDGTAGRTIFISGTAAVLGHATIAPDDTREQLKHTISNLREISHACGIGRNLGGAQACAREFTIYLRHAHEFPAMRAALDEYLFLPKDRVTFTRADICRRSLAIEIEAMISC